MVLNKKIGCFDKTKIAKKVLKSWQKLDGCLRLSCSHVISLTGMRIRLIYMYGLSELKTLLNSPWCLFTLFTHPMNKLKE